MGKAVAQTGAEGSFFQKDDKQSLKPTKLQGSIIIESHGLNSSGAMWMNLNAYLSRVDRKAIFCGYIDLSLDPKRMGNYYGLHPVIYKRPEWKPVKKYANSIIGQSGEEYYVVSKEPAGSAYFKIPEDDAVVKPGLFLQAELEKINRTIKKAKPNEQKELFQDQVKKKVAELVKANKTVIFAINYSNNQDDFRRQGAELKQAIDLIRPEGLKVDVIGHSMGCLATASYIAGIAGVPYGYDIDQFVALGAPFGGEDIGSVYADFTEGRLVYPVTNKIREKAPVADKVLSFHPNYFVSKKIENAMPNMHEKGPAYKCLQSKSEAIKQLRTAWNAVGPCGVRAYSLQGYNGDWVVSRQSSFCLKHMTHYVMEDKVFHCSQSDHRAWQQSVYNILAKGNDDKEIEAFGERVENRYEAVKKLDEAKAFEWAIKDSYYRSGP